jgi:hypothetical protein
MLYVKPSALQAPLNPKRLDMWRRYLEPGQEIARRKASSSKLSVFAWSNAGRLL